MKVPGCCSLEPKPMTKSKIEQTQIGGKREFAYAHSHMYNINWDAANSENARNSK